MKKVKIAAAVFALLLAGLAAFLIVFDRSGFTGVRVKNPDSYTLDIQRMNGTDRHTMELTAGDALQVAFETKKGSLHMQITAPDGTVLYAGNGEETTGFELGIPETGVYSITVKARHAEGSIHVRLKEAVK